MTCASFGCKAAKASLRDANRGFVGFVGRQCRSGAEWSAPVAAQGLTAPGDAIGSIPRYPEGYQVLISRKGSAWRRPRPRDGAGPGADNMLLPRDAPVLRNRQMTPDGV